MIIRKYKNMPTWCFVLLLTLVSVLPLHAELADDTSGAALEVEALVNEALAANPALAAARHEQQAADLKVKPAGTFPDPTVILGVQALPVDTFAFDEWDMTQKVIGITQPLPFPGKLKLSRTVAKSESESALHQVEMIEDQLAFEIRRTFLEWAYTEEAAWITERNRGVIAQFNEIATARYAVGKGTQWDILRAQVEHSKLSERSATLEQSIESYRAMMAKLLGRNDARIEGVPQVGWTPVIPLDEKELILRAEKSNPKLAYFKSLVEKADNSAKLARRERLPDFSVTVTYGQREDGEMNGESRERPDFISGMVGIKVPLYSGRKQTPLYRAAEQQSIGARSRLANERLRIRAEIRDRVLRIKRAEAVEELYRSGILPQARTTVQSAIASYQVNKVDFLTLLSSELALINHELDYYRVRIDREIDFAALTLLLGEPVISTRNSDSPTPRVEEGGEENESP